MADGVKPVPFVPYLLAARHEGREVIWYAVCRESGLRWRVETHLCLKTGKGTNEWGYRLVPKPRKYDWSRKPVGRISFTDEERAKAFRRMWEQVWRS